MCLIFISIQHHPAYKLIIAGNRDEFYDRKTAPAGYWEDYRSIIGGRDLEAGGTWMGMNTSGSISMLTNYRDPQHIDPVAPSRGQLVADFLKNDIQPDAYLHDIENNGKRYNGFNLIVGNADELWYYSNYKKGIEQLTPGLHGISNHLLDTPWPKVVRGKKRVNELLKKNVIDPSELFEILYDDVVAEDSALPATGLSLDRERGLSSMFIKMENYGSRCSTVVLVDKANQVTFAERVFNLSTFEYTTQTFQFQIPLL